MSHKKKLLVSGNAFKMAAARRIDHEVLNLLAEIAIRIILFVIFWVLEDAPPFERMIHDEEMWLYKNPKKSKDVVPTPTLFCIATLVPLFVIGVFAILRKDKLDGKQAVLGLTLSLLLNGVITNSIKLLVGRPRPDFFWRCWPNGVATANLKCNGNLDDIQEGRKSFPSGHSSWAFSGLAFLSLYLAGKLHCFQGIARSQSWRLCAAILPSLGALCIALTRYSDYKHHWQDVTVGSLIGLSIAYLCYRQYYPGVNRSHCHLPLVALTPHHRIIDEHEPLLPLTTSKEFHPVITKSL